MQGQEQILAKYLDGHEGATKSKTFREINSREDRPRARPGFVKPIRNGLRRVKNLIESRLSRAETGLAGRERMELGSRKKSRWDSIMRSKSIDTQEMREIGRKEAGESRKD